MSKKKMIDISGHPALRGKQEQEPAREAVEIAPHEALAQVVGQIAGFYNDLEASTRAGRQHPSGVYAKHQASVITMDGRSDQVELVAAILPIGVLQMVRNCLVEMQASDAALKGGGHAEH